ncbi:MAG: hypothetical protein ABSA11_03915 [Candidatus Bathyarchaeia archaeon]|jgi:hypothetical protein
MRSYIKIMGPPLGKALKELEKIAIDMPQVCIMDEAIMHGIPKELSEDVGESVKYSEHVGNLFAERTGVVVETERCSKIISKSDRVLGEYDFFFEWFKKPRINDLNDLIQKVDDILAPLGVHYTITTK